MIVSELSSSSQKNSGCNSKSLRPVENKNPKSTPNLQVYKIYRLLQRLLAVWGLQGLQIYRSTPDCRQLPGLPTLRQIPEFADEWALSLALPLIVIIIVMGIGFYISGTGHSHIICTVKKVSIMKKKILEVVVVCLYALRWLWVPFRGSFLYAAKM